MRSRTTTLSEMSPGVGISARPHCLLPTLSGFYDMKTSYRQYWVTCAHVVVSCANYHVLCCYQLVLANTHLAFATCNCSDVNGTYQQNICLFDFLLLSRSLKLTLHVMGADVDSEQKA